MNPLAHIDREQVLGVLITLATALFLMAIAPRFPYRRAARIAAVVFYGAAFVGVVIWVVLWLCGVKF
jgi:hypothetical protein